MIFFYYSLIINLENIIYIINLKYSHLLKEF